MNFSNLLFPALRCSPTTGTITPRGTQAKTNTRTLHAQLQYVVAHLYSSFLCTYFQSTRTSYWVSTSQVAFYTNCVGKFEKMRRNRQTERQTKPGCDKTNAHLWHIYSHTPTHKLITVHLRRTVTRSTYCMYMSNQAGEGQCCSSTPNDYRRNSLNRMENHVTHLRILGPWSQCEGQS